MDNQQLTLFIKMCLHFNIPLRLYEQDIIIKMQEKYKIPDDVLKDLTYGQFKNYVKALSILSDTSDFKDWEQGIILLKKLGFERNEVRQGHRVFVNMVFKQLNNE